VGAGGQAEGGGQPRAAEVSDTHTKHIYTQSIHIHTQAHKQEHRHTHRGMPYVSVCVMHACAAPSLCACLTSLLSLLRGCACSVSP
jgi:hypothetical protein